MLVLLYLVKIMETVPAWAPQVTTAPALKDIRALLALILITASPTLVLILVCV